MTPYEWVISVFSFVFITGTALAIIYFIKQWRKG